MEGLLRGKIECHSLNLFPVYQVSVVLFLSLRTGADCPILKAGEESFL